MEKMEIGDLGVFPDEEAVYPLVYTQVGELLEGTPEGAFATPWLRANLGCFRITLSVVSHEKQSAEYSLALTGRKSDHALEKLAHIVKSFKKELR